MKQLFVPILLFVSVYCNAQTLYGFNENTYPDYNNKDFLDAMKSMHPNIIRYPGGKISTDFDWKAVKKPTLPSLALMQKKVECDILFVMNMNTSTLAYQMQMLDSAAALGIPIKYIEFGNEVSNTNNPLRKKFHSSGAEYGKECKRWAAAIKAKYPKAKFAAWGENKPDLPDWNKQLLSAFTPDALVNHIYPNDTVISKKGMIDTVFFRHWLEHSFDRTGIDFSIPIWITEYNLLPRYRNVLQKGQHKFALVFMSKVLSEIGRKHGGKGVDMLIMHSLAQGTNGAVQVSEKGAVRFRATGKAFKKIMRQKAAQQQQIPIAFNLPGNNQYAD